MAGQDRPVVMDGFDGPGFPVGHTQAASLRRVTMRSPAPTRIPSMPTATRTSSTAPAATRRVRTAWLTWSASSLVATVTANASSSSPWAAISAAMAATASAWL